ncbi:unnamed protein product, partial [Rotaria magnacalcarata]
VATIFPPAPSLSKRHFQQQDIKPVVVTSSIPPPSTSSSSSSSHIPLDNPKVTIGKLNQLFRERQKRNSL